MPLMQPSHGIIASMQRVATGPAGPHRHWVFVTVGSRERYLALAELELAATVGGADQTAGKTITSNESHWGVTATYLGRGLGYAIDNNADTFAIHDWINTSVQDCLTIAIDFGSPVYAGELRIRALPSSFSSIVKASPAGGILCGSDDGVTLIPYLAVVSPDLWIPGEQRAWPVTGNVLATDRSTARIWYLRVTANNGNTSAGVKELMFRGASGGPSLCIGGVPGTTNAYAGFDGDETAWGGFDGAGNSGRWNTAAGGAALSPRLTYLFPSAPNPTHVAMMCADIPNRMPRDFEIGYSLNGLVRVPVLTVTGATGWSVDEIREWALP
ncbi:hypothetical protein GXW74_15515 [Roseomonas eburnea]|uniref:Uncharacterized protein n=1 Tax=Neoroseomonas eburnea TaxID=1346889 RepID=A0A9X9XDW6_9PROT|nr:hypothetical protein [Neoroseomonas eburnea]MBR0681902.1 hypothetical protein [Neoroseomonas eburnea]